MVLMIRALLLVAMVHGCCGIPVFSWRTLPVFYHTSVMDTVTFSDEDLVTISRYPAVTIEKWQGCNSSAGCYPVDTGRGPCITQQEASLATAAKLKALNPNISVFFWFDSLRIYSNKTYNPEIIDKEFQSCVRNAVTPFMETHPSLLLHTATGALAADSYLNAHIYDHSQAAVRALWQQACVNMTLTGLVDGCGADASWQDSSDIKGLNASTAAAWTAGHNLAMANTAKALQANGHVLLGKLGSELGTVNGVLQEGCGAGNDTINVLLNATAASIRDGVPYVYECHSSDGSLDDMAAFLIGCGPNQYWGTGPWVYQTGGFAKAAWLAEYDRPLGEPMEAAGYDSGTQTWSRRFASASVTFDLKTNKGTITWHASEMK